MQKKYQLLLSKINKNELLFAFLIAFMVIFLVISFGFYNNKVVLQNPDPHAHYLLEPNNPLKILANWDGVNYLNVAQNSYSNASQAIFLPLYPILVRFLFDLVHSYLDSALIISWFAFGLAIFFYIKIVKEVFKEKDNFKTLNYLFYFVFFPTAVFFVATYTESLFALLALIGIYTALKKKYFISSLATLLLGITNVDAVLVILFVLIILIENKASLMKIISYALVAFSGLAAYLVYLAVRFHTMLAFLPSQQGQGWLNHNYSELIAGLNPFSLGFIVLLILSAYYWWDKRKSFSIYSLSFLLIPILGNQFGGFNRYVLMAFPMQLMLWDYLKNKPKLFALSLVLISICWSYFVFQYVGGYVGG